MEKKTKLYNFIKAVLIAALAVLIIWGLSGLLVLKSEDGINQFDALYKQPKNSIDVLFVGSSKVYCDIATGVLWDDHGIAAFDLGGAEAPAWVSYYQLKEALRSQRPKVICYEVSVAAMYDFSYQKDSWASDNAYGMKWNENRIEQLRVNSEGDSFYLRLNPFNVMHGRYNSLSENDFTNVRNTANYKGFDPRESVVPQEEPVPVEDCSPCPEKDEEYIRKIIALAREENIPLVLFASPESMPAESQMIINYIGTIAEAEGVPFMDFNKSYHAFGMDYATDMADSDHLNYSGNRKFTSYFGSVLKEQYDLPDRRGDKRYVSWEWDAALQRQERNDLAIVNCEDVNEIWNLTFGSYLVFEISGDQAILYEDNSTVDFQMITESGDEPFKIAYKSGPDSFLFTEGMGKEGRIAKIFVNDTEYQTELRDQIFVYDTMRREFVKSLCY